jgi:hypothetical protein
MLPIILGIGYSVIRGSDYPVFQMSVVRASDYMKNRIQISSRIRVDKVSDTHSPLRPNANLSDTQSPQRSTIISLCTLACPGYVRYRTR